jgi:hypothetical protein
LISLAHTAHAPAKLGPFVSSSTTSLSGASEFRVARTKSQPLFAQRSRGAAAADKDDADALEPVRVTRRKQSAAGRAASHANRKRRD